MGLKEKYAYVEVKQDYHRIILTYFHSTQMKCNLTMKKEPLVL